VLGTVLLPLLLAGAPTVPGAAPAQRLRELPGLANVGRVAPGIYRGGAPNDEGLDTLRRMGIRTVINLRHFHGSGEERGCRRRGLGYVRIALASSDAPADRDVRHFLAVVTDPLRQPVYFHCLRGKDRTGVMCAVYRMAVLDWTLADALREMDGFGFYHGWHDLRRYVQEFDARRALFRPPAVAPLRPAASAPRLGAEAAGP
jgi:tyrosine-protein phosphatase SIW14